MPVRHAPFWFNRYPGARRPSFPPFKGEADTTVAIVGGGLTGCTCAFSFAAAGIKVALVEADAIGGGATAASPGIIREDFDQSFHATAGTHGLRTARLLWQGLHRASLDFPAALRRLDARCDLAPAEMIQFTRRETDAATRLRREYQSRRDAGLDHSWVTPAALAREAAIEAGGGLRTRGAAFDPYRACLALAAAATARGAAVHERSTVRRICAGRRQVEITLDRGSFRADAVVIATAAPFQDLRALRRHLDPREGYAVVTEPMPAHVRRDVGRRAAVLRDPAAPPHLLRWMKEDRILFMGADQAEVPARLREKTLVQRTGQLMYELSTLYPAISGMQPDWSWQVTHYETVDGLPLVGLHRNFPRHLFALGGLRHGAAFAWLAARILLRQFQGGPAKGDELFGFTRIL
jgi:glycine/D-amino acid oxidase-like deaminating enzyme